MRSASDAHWRRGMRYCRNDDLLFPLPWVSFGQHLHVLPSAVFSENADTDTVMSIAGR